MRTLDSEAMFAVRRADDDTWVVRAPEPGCYGAGFNGDWRSAGTVLI